MKYEYYNTRDEVYNMVNEHHNMMKKDHTAEGQQRGEDKGNRV
jgi:hypothetical protein